MSNYKKVNTSKYIVIGKKITLYIIIFTLCFLIFDFATREAVAQMPASTNYELDSYSFGSGTASSSSESFNLFGTAGEVETSTQSSETYNVNSGLSFLMSANIPGITLTNTGSNYDRLQAVIDPNDNPADTTYTIQVSTDSTFSTNVYYVKTDNTLGTTLEETDWRTYASFGSATGIAITGLTQNTTYYARANARSGSDSGTESGWGSSSNSSTVSPSLTFSIDSATVTFANLNSGNSFTDSSKTTVLTTSTNAYNGYIINARSTGPLTFGAETISDYNGTNSSPTTWSGNGFGYTTNDSSLTGGTADRFTNGGPKYAGFTTSSPGDPVADHAGPVTSPITNEQFTISYRVTVSNAQKAGDYETTVLYIVVPEY